jgi:molybdopterin synthase sulfur carrier subunit
MIRVVLPFHLRNLAGISGEVAVDVPAPATLKAVLEAIEDRYPVLRGTIREHGSLKRRSLVRFFVCKEDWSERAPETVLPDAIAAGTEPMLIIGAMAGG